MLSAITHCEGCYELLMCFRWLCITDASESESVLMSSCNYSLDRSISCHLRCLGAASCSSRRAGVSQMPCVVSVSQVGRQSNLGVSEIAVGTYIWATAPTFQRGSAGQGLILSRCAAQLKTAFCLQNVWTLHFLSLTTIINNFMISSFILNCYWLMKFLFLSFDTHSCYFLKNLWVSLHH